jgi:hypothetical protein
MITNEETICNRPQAYCKFTFEDLGILVAALRHYEERINDETTEDERIHWGGEGASLRTITKTRALCLRTEKYLSSFTNHEGED